MMKKLFLLLFVLVLWACSDEKVSGISTVETENAFLIQIVRSDSMPAANVVARVRSEKFIRNDEDGSAKEGFFEEYVTDTLGRIRIDSLAVDVATIEIVDKGEGVFRKLAAKDVREGELVQFVLEKTEMLRGKVYLPEGVDYALVQVYGTDRLAKTDSEGFYEIESMPPFEYDMRVVVGDSVIECSAKVDAGEKAIANVYDFEPDSVKVLDFETGDAVFSLKEIDRSVTGYFAVTDTSVKTVPVIGSKVSEGVEEAGAGREGKALHWKTSAGFGVWSFFGIWICPENSTCNFSKLDSVVYYVRGTGHYSFSFEALGKSNIEGKALTEDSLNGSDEWKRVCVKPSDFLKADSSYGNFGWDIVKKKVTTISVFAYDETELWIDDITLYGVKPSDFAVK
jgi:hypothetical protein